MARCRGDVGQQRPCDARWEERVFTLEDASRPNRYMIRNLAFNQCLTSSTTSVPTTATIETCTTTHTYVTHPLDVR